MQSVKLSVVIPAYNESTHIRDGQLEQVYRFLARKYRSFELVVVNDGSTDATLKLLRAFAHDKAKVRVINNPHQGKGPTLITGMLKARGKYRIFTDMDQSTPISEIEKLLATMQTGADIAIGSRMIDGAGRKDNPLHRRIMGEGFSWLVNVLAVDNIKDTQCGFKMFTGEATQQLFGSLYVYGKDKTEKRAYTGAIDVELLFLAQKFGFTIQEVAVMWRHKDTNRVNPIIDSVRMLWDVLKIRMADLTGKYSQT